MKKIKNQRFFELMHFWLNYNNTITIITIGRSSKAGREWWTPYQSLDPNPTKEIIP